MQWLRSSRRPGLEVSASSNESQGKPTTAPFFQLPREIRDEIYLLVLVDQAWNRLFHVRTYRGTNNSVLMRWVPRTSTPGSLEICWSKLMRTKKVCQKRPTPTSAFEAMAVCMQWYTEACATWFRSKDFASLDPVATTEILRRGGPIMRNNILSLQLFWGSLPMSLPFRCRETVASMFRKSSYWSITTVDPNLAAVFADLGTHAPDLRSLTFLITRTEFSKLGKKTRKVIARRAFDQTPVPPIVDSIAKNLSHVQEIRLVAIDCHEYQGWLDEVEGLEAFIKFRVEAERKRRLGEAV